MSETHPPLSHNGHLDDSWRQRALARWRRQRAEGPDDDPVLELAPRILQRVGEAIGNGALQDGPPAAPAGHLNLVAVLQDLRLLRRAALDELRDQGRCVSASERGLLHEVFDRSLAAWIHHALDEHVEEERTLRAAAESSAAECGALQHRLLEEQEIREGFVAAVVHDLRSPLTAVSFAMELIERQHGVSGVRDKALARARRGVERIDHLAQRLLDANRLSSTERFPLHLEPMDLAVFCVELIDDLAHLSGPERLTYEGPDSGVMGAFDRGALHGIVENLVRNALKYGDEGQVTLRLTAEPDEVSLAVHNTGNPIAPEDQERIFERFVRLESARQFGTGWGIGLALVRGLCTELGGSIGVRSDAEHGTTFTVRLPRHRPTS